MNEILFCAHVILLYVIGVMIFQQRREWQVVWLCVMPILANLTLAKQIMICGFEVTSSDVYSVAYFVGMNHYHETYGKKAAFELVRLSMLCIIVMPLLLLMHTFYLPSVHDVYHEVFVKIFGFVPWVAAVSVASFTLSQYLERTLFAYSQTMIQGHYHYRSFITASISQLFDTAFFTFFAVSYLVHQPWHVFIISYVIKQIIICGWFCISRIHQPEEPHYVRD